ncbi:biotin transport system substrate-specific component [Blastococcus colisei]|uniref:Biotin transporter n=1 Tax=Blastococcus colisei TaxID=1564162 RepID=A0A543PJ48_9ACTN|nr:biotin transporter BioY [Blastococcus colisei]TQN44112.1 biotin transport system substrate-specific component [Blastococcus colisei]
MSNAAHPLPRRVIADALPGGLARDVTLVIGARLFLAVFNQISIPLPFTPVPVTGGTFGALVIGAALGPVRGGAGALLYLAVGVAGLPWFADGQAGWAFASFGYLLGYVAAAIVVGALARRGADRTALRTFALMALGSLTIYALGVPWLMAFLGIDLAEVLSLGVLPFLLGDTLKALLAAGLLPGAWKLLDRRPR